MEPPSKKILIVDVEERAAIPLRDGLEKEGMQVVVLEAPALLSLRPDEPIFGIFIDPFQVPRRALEAIGQVRTRMPHIPFCLYTTRTKFKEPPATTGEWRERFRHYFKLEYTQSGPSADDLARVLSLFAEYPQTDGPGPDFSPALWRIIRLLATIRAHGLSQIHVLAATVWDALGHGIENQTEATLIALLGFNRMGPPAQASKLIGLSDLPIPSRGRVPRVEGFTPEIRNVFDLARIIRSTSDPATTLSRIHLLVALITAPVDRSIVDALQLVGTDLYIVRRRFASYAPTYAPLLETLKQRPSSPGPDAPEAKEANNEINIIPQPTPTLPAQGTLAGYRSDTPDGNDLLGITPDVTALSSVVAAQSVNPPLSIGLFGDWGMGKSFFMKEMQAAIQRLATESPRTRDERGDEVFVRNVVQIRFNAWHYADGNLWATLTTSIFEALARHGVKSNAPHLIDLLKEQLQSARLAEQSASTDLMNATAERQFAERHARDLQERRRELERKIASDQDLLSLLPAKDELTKLANRVSRLLPDSPRQVAVDPAKILEWCEEVTEVQGYWGTLRWWWTRGGTQRWLLIGAATSIICEILLLVLPQLGFKIPLPLHTVLLLLAPFALQWRRARGALNWLAAFRKKVEEKEREGGQQRAQVLSVYRKAEAKARKRVEQIRQSAAVIEEQIRGEDPNEKFRRYSVERARDDRYRSRNRSRGSSLT